MASKILLLAVALAVVAMVITSTSAAPAEQFNKAGNDDGKDKPQEIIEGRLCWCVQLHIVVYASI